MLNYDILTWKNIVLNVRIKRCRHTTNAGFHIAEEAQQLIGIESLGETLAAHQSAFFQFGIGIKKAVGRQQINARMIRPARKKRFQDTCRRTFADRHRSGDTNNKRHLAVLAAEELQRNGMQLLLRRDIEIEEARQRQINLFDLIDGQLFDNARELFELVRLKRHRRIGTQPRPLFPGKGAIR